MKTMTMDEYHAHPAIGKSGLDRIAKSPAHYLAWLKEKPEPTKEQRIGTMAHMAILEPELFAATYAVLPEKPCNAKDDKPRYDAWKAECDALQADANKKLVAADEYQTVKEIQDAFYSHTVTSNVLKGALIEHSAFWGCGETGADCKARPDAIQGGGVIFDIKTTKDASKAEFARDIAKWRYHVQGAYYLNGVTNVTGTAHNEFVFVAVEKTYPYAIALYRLGKDDLKQGLYTAKENLHTYVKCKRTGIWPAYPEDVQTINLPTWAVV